MVEGLSLHLYADIGGSQGRPKERLTSENRGGFGGMSGRLATLEVTGDSNIVDGIEG